MTTKKPGLLGKNNTLNRTPGNIKPIEKFQESSAKKEIQSKNKEFKNQKGSIKIPSSTKKEIDAIKTISNVKFDYEVLQLLIDSYTAQLDSSKYKLFKLLTENL